MTTNVTQDMVADRSASEKRAIELLGQGYNCAQAVIGALLENEGVDPEFALHLALGFGSGMQSGEICGAVSGGIMAIGKRCGDGKQVGVAEKEFCRLKTKAFNALFLEKNHSLLCKDLLGMDANPADPKDKAKRKELIRTICPGLVAYAVRTVESMDFSKE